MDFVLFLSYYLIYACTEFTIIFKTSIYWVKYIYNYIVIVIVFWSTLVKITSVTGLTLKRFNKVQSTSQSRHCGGIHQGSEVGEGRNILGEG